MFSGCIEKQWRRSGVFIVNFEHVNADWDIGRVLMQLLMFWENYERRFTFHVLCGIVHDSSFVGRKIFMSRKKDGH